MRRLGLALVVVLLAACPAFAQGTTVPPSIELQDEGVSQGRITKFNCAGAGVSCARSGTTGTATIGGGSGAPTDATYVTQTPDATLSAEQALSALGDGLMLNATGTGIISIYGGSACGSGTDAVNSISASGAVTCITPSGSGAPTTAKYIVQEADAGLSAEQSLGLLTTGLTLNTVTGAVGVLSAYGGTSCTNQFPRALDASGSATCASVANTDLANSSITLNGNSIALGGTDTLVLASADFANQGTTTTVLHGNAAGNPSFGAVSLAVDVTGTLAIGSGGTGQTTTTAAFDALAPTTTQGDIIYHNGTANVRLGPGTSGQFLQTQGAGANPQWATPSGSGGARYFFTGSLSSAQTADAFCVPQGGTASAAATAPCSGTSDFDTRMIVPVSGTIKNLRCWLSAAQDIGDTCACTIRVGTNVDTAGSDTTLTCSVVDTAQSCSNTSDTPSVTAGEGIEFYFDEQGGSCNARFTWSFELEPS